MSNAKRNDYWVPGTSASGLISAVSPAISAALLSFAAAVNRRDRPEILACLRDLRHVITRMEAYNRYMQKEWLKGDAPPHESDDRSNAGERHKVGGLEQSGEILRSSRLSEKIATQSARREPDIPSAGDNESKPSTNKE